MNYTKNKEKGHTMKTKKKQAKQPQFYCRMYAKRNKCKAYRNDKTSCEECYDCVKIK